MDASLVNVGHYAPFITLPLEIIVEILKEFDWHSLLKIRLVRRGYLLLIPQFLFCCQTCKLFSALSRIRDIWISQYHQYAAQHMGFARLEEPLESYSALELERWVLLRRSADVGWGCENTKFSRNRWVSKNLEVWGSCIVPGGRWLLVGSMDGSVETYDLDASILTGKPLIPRGEQDEPQPVHYIAIDIDSQKQSPTLTFNMALLAYLQYSKSWITYC